MHSFCLSLFVQFLYIINAHIGEYAFREPMRLQEACTHLAEPRLVKAVFADNRFCIFVVFPVVKKVYAKPLSLTILSPVFPCSQDDVNALGNRRCCRNPQARVSSRPASHPSVV